MQLKKVALTALTIFGAVSGFVVDYYSEGGCTGEFLGNVNVWDSTCTNNVEPYRSVRVLALGSNLQHAHFYYNYPFGCGLAWDGYWADGQSPEFQVGLCINMHEKGTTGKFEQGSSFGSWLY